MACPLLYPDMTPDSMRSRLKLELSFLDGSFFINHKSRFDPNLS